MSGVISRGVRAPIIREGDDIVSIVADSVEAAMREDGFELHERDVVAVTESVVARADGNYASVDDIAADVRAKLGGETVGVVFPILSRNRFAICLRGIARGCRKVVLMLSYPSDEVGNHLFDLDALDESGVDPYRDVLSLAKYRSYFGYVRHPFTGVDYVEYYEHLIREEGAECEIVFANRPEAIVNFTRNVLCCDIHSRYRTQRHVKAAGGEDAGNEPRKIGGPVPGVVANVSRRARRLTRPQEAERVCNARHPLLVKAIREAGVPSVNAKADDVGPPIQRGQRPSRRAPRRRPQPGSGHRAPCARWLRPTQQECRCRSPQQDPRRGRTSLPRRAGAPWRRSAESRSLRPAPA